MGHQTLISLSQFCQGGDSGKQYAAIFTATAWVTLCAMWAAAAITDRLIDQRPAAMPDQAVPSSSSRSFGSGRFV